MRLALGLRKVGKLRGFAARSAGESSSWGLLAAVRTRLSVLQACSNAPGLYCLLAVAYHLSTSALVILDTSMSPKWGMSLSSASLTMRLLLPHSFVPSFLRYESK